MADEGYRRFFCQLTGKAPYPYQVRLATAPELPVLAGIPTGAGKTLATFGAWLYRRRYHPDLAVRAATPRRLVYCLPMRVLVEQTVQVAHDCLRRIGVLADHGEAPNGVQLTVLMGGEDGGDWDLDPVSDAVIVGTQDMLLSRALNRGYGMSRFRWPVHFGLLNNDCLWVIDEVQLMANGLATTVQLDAFRHAFGAVGPYHTIWMSATIAPEWLRTVDSRVGSSTAFTLDGDDRRELPLKQRLCAAKRLFQLGLSSVGGKPYKAADLAEKILGEHQRGTLTMAVVNTVPRAQELGEAVEKLCKRMYRNEADRPEIILIHSRLRPVERKERVERLVQPVVAAGRIVIATQVVEAGVDLSARTIFTELAPWASLVQRFGRANRTGEDTDARVFWIDIEARYAAPYAATDLEDSRRRLGDLEGKSIAPDEEALRDGVSMVPATHVVRRRDLVDLFDTTPDLSGNDVDVSRFVRGTDELDVHVFWRDWQPANMPPGATEPAPSRVELCAVPVSELRTFLQKQEGSRGSWVWDHLDRSWRRLDLRLLRPGMTVLLHRTTGGYSTATGWVGSKAKETLPVPQRDQGKPPEATGDDFQTATTWQSLAEHSQHAVEVMDTVLFGLEDGTLSTEMAQALRLAARHHDRGKAHLVFQTTLLKSVAGTDEHAVRAATIWAKAPPAGRHSRPHFRHELASALALLQSPNGGIAVEWRDLAAYLVAAHHGKVRLAIRSVPDERPTIPSRRIALGIEEGDELPPTDLGGGVIAPAVMLNLTCSQIGLGDDGQPSWLERMIHWRDTLGPFRLAYLEALIVAADVIASQHFSEGGG